MGLDILNLFQLNIGVFCGLVLSINIIIKVCAQDGKRQRCSRTSSPVRTVSQVSDKLSLALFEFSSMHLWKVKVKSMVIHILRCYELYTAVKTPEKSSVAKP